MLPVLKLIRLGAQSAWDGRDGDAARGLVWPDAAVFTEERRGSNGADEPDVGIPLLSCRGDDDRDNPYECQCCGLSPEECEIKSYKMDMRGY